MSKIKLGKTGIDFIKEWVIKTALKQQPKGVLTTLPEKNFVDLNTSITAERLMRNGVDPNSIKNVDQVENIINQLNKPKVVSQGDPEFKGIMDNIMGKNVIEADFGKPFSEEIKNVKKRIDSGVASTVEKMLAMEPIDAMKEANKIIGRKGQYKNLSQEDAKKILQDTEDHIFERNVDIDPEDMFADGGRIGLRGGKDASQSDFKTPSTTAKAPPSMGFGNPPPAPTGGGGGDNNKPPKKIKISEPVKSGIDTYNNLNYLKNIYKLNPKGIMLDIGKQFLMNKLFSEAETEENQNMMLAKEGGRIGFKKGSMDRRTFMKIIGGLTTLPVLGKFFKGAEVAAPVTQKVMENFSSKASEAPTYFFNLMTKIKVFGKKSKVGPSDRVDEYSYTGKNGDQYTLTEDITTGDAQITKDKMGIGTSGDKSFDVIEDRTVMDYKARKQDVDVETQRPIDESAEYEEYKVDFDQDGTEAGADAIDEYIQKEIIEEAAEEAPSIKKASGGIARMLGE
jgi:hypothetical protein